MSKLINGFSLEEVNAFRQELIEEALQDVADCKKYRYPDMVVYYQEKAENYRFAPVSEIVSFMMAYKFLKK